MNQINSIDKKKITAKLKKIKIHLISDSSIKLCGNKGQISVFSKQKKIKKFDQKHLAKSFEKMKNIFEKNSKKNFNLPYLGSGGGVTSMIYFIFKCKLSNGANFIFKKQKIKQYIKRNAIVISGEGKLDKTTFEGKGLSKIISATKKVERNYI